MRALRPFLDRKALLRLGLAAFVALSIAAVAYISIVVYFVAHFLDGRDPSYEALSGTGNCFNWQRNYASPARERFATVREVQCPAGLGQDIYYYVVFITDRGHKPSPQTAILQYQPTFDVAASRSAAVPTVRWQNDDNVIVQASGIDGLAIKKERLNGVHIEYDIDN